MDLLFAILVLLIIWGAYVLPTLIAFERQHPNRVSILVVNIFFGWTLIFWVICLAWALSHIAPREPIPNQG